MQTNFNRGSIYVAGPMRGYAQLNFPKLNEITAKLRERDYVAINPVEINPNQDADYLDCMREDIKALADCAAIYLLDGWEMSEGANAEYQVARILKLEVFFEGDLI